MLSIITIFIYIHIHILQAAQGKKGMRNVKFSMRLKKGGAAEVISFDPNSADALQWGDQADTVNYGLLPKHKIKRGANNKSRLNMRV